jgi:hypothetical protein
MKRKIYPKQGFKKVQADFLMKFENFSFIQGVREEKIIKSSIIKHFTVPLGYKVVIITFLFDCKGNIYWVV